MHINWHRLLDSTIAILLCATPVNVLAGADGDTVPLRLTVSLVSPSTISLGEPILIHYDLSNDSERKVGLERGVYGTTWYDAVVTDDKGNKAPTTPDLRPIHPTGAYSTADVFLNGSSHIAGYVVATKSVKIERPGRYTLFLLVHLPYAFVEGSSQESQETPEALAEKSGLVMTQEVTFPIVVTQQDRNHLHSTAETLRQATEKEQDTPLARAEMDALFSMPSTQAAVSWKAIALRPSMSTDAVADELAQLHSTVGVDILARMLSTPGVSSRHISNRLNELYNDSNTELRVYIKTVAAGLGIKMPSKVDSAIVID